MEQIALLQGLLKIRTKLQGKSYGHSNMAYCWVNNDKNECMILKDNLKIFLLSASAVRKSVFVDLRRSNQAESPENTRFSGLRLKKRLIKITAQGYSVRIQASFRQCS